MYPVLIVAHGQPSAPAPAAAELAAFAAAVAALLPGHVVASATLAEPGALPRAVARLGPGGVVFPMFMAGGWFARVNLPAQLAAAGAVGWRVLEPLGCDPALHDLAVTVVAGAAEVVLAAHGSFKTSVPSDVARVVADKIAAQGTRVAVGFIDQEPQLSSLRGFGPEAVCLPYFAAAGGHVSADIPRALAEAGFQGRVLPALGLDPRVPALVAAAVLRRVPVCAAECRFKQVG